MNATTVLVSQDVIEIHPADLQELINNSSRVVDICKTSDGVIEVSGKHYRSSDKVPAKKLYPSAVAALDEYIASVRNAYTQSKILKEAGIEVPWIRISDVLIPEDDGLIHITVGTPKETTKRVRLEIR